MRHILPILLTTASLYCVELYDDKKINRINIIVESPIGAPEIDSRTILQRLKTKEGDDFSQLTFDNDLKTLSDEFERVDPKINIKNGTLYISIHVTPRPVIHQILWNGNSQFSNSTLQKELEIKPNTLFNRQQFNKAFNKVKEYYFKKGYFEAQLSYDLQPLNGLSEVDVVIDIQEGRPGHIQAINFIGFDKDDESEIVEQMYLKKYNILTSWLTGSGIYRDEAMEQDKMTIINYLQNKGYADAKVNIKLSEDEKTNKLIIDIHADKGQVYHFGNVMLEGNSLFTQEQLKKYILINQHTVYSPDRLRDTTQSIKDFYGQKGYIEASVQYETVLREDEPVFDIYFTVDEGQQYKVGLIHIFGNVSTKSNVILRESLLVPGETFDARKLRATQARLQGIGYFKNVNVYAVRTEEDESLGLAYRDVYIEVEETTTGNVSLFLGFSSMDDVYGGIDLTERNFNVRGFTRALGGKLSELRGGGEYFHIRGTAGKKQNNVLVSWMNPYVYDTLWRLGVEISTTWSELQNNVKVITYGGSVYTNYPLSTYWTAGMRQRLRHAKDDLKLSAVDDSQIARDSVAEMKHLLEQDGLISAFSGNLNYDSTDSANKPRKGWRSYFETEFVGVGGNYHFFKASYLNNIYVPVWKKGTMKFRGEFKYIIPFGNKNYQVPYSERFFLGGETTVRGYKPFVLGPLVPLLNAQGQTQYTDTPYGGLSSTLLSVEYNQQIFKMMDVFAFVDSGSLTFGEFDLNNYRFTIGAGVRLDLGNGTPIMVGYGYPLDKNDRNDTKWQKVFFSMGGHF